jgi:hypothetical protein
MAAGAEGFANGRYEEAKRLLVRTVSRNKRYAAQMPVKMADLYATLADVSMHEGDVDRYRRATWDSVAVLREHLGSKDLTTLIATQRVGDMLVATGMAGAADAAYADAAKVARDAGSIRLAAFFDLRRAWLATQDKNRAKARKLIDTVRAGSGGDRWVASMVQVFDLRLALASGDEARADALLAGLRGARGSEPVLLSAPDYDLPETAQRSAFTATGNLNLQTNQGQSRGSTIRWVDIGFWVRPDGKADGAEVLRPLQTAPWSAALLRQIAARRYAPLAASDEAGVYRIERFTLRPKYQIGTGSRVATRTGPVSVETIDITRLSMREAEGQSAGE